MATTDVILREKIHNLGSEGDIVTVKAGYASNFLFVQGKALPATKAYLKQLESLKQKRLEREAQELETAQQLASKIKSTPLSFTLETGQGGKAFGSITSIDIHKALEEKNILVDRHSIDLDAPIKTSGKQKVAIKLHPEVTATLNFSIKAQED